MAMIISWIKNTFGDFYLRCITRLKLQKKSLSRKYDSTSEAMKKQGILIAIWGFALIAFGALTIYAMVFRHAGLSPDPTNWGVFGDYVGGVLGTIFNVLGVVLIYLTFRKQEEYSHIERFETTFFNLLTNQRDIVKSLFVYVPDNLTASTHKLESYEFINYFCQALSKHLKHAKPCLNVDSCQIELSVNYNHIYEAKANQFGHYFRHLYHIIKYIDESDIKDKMKYCDIVQSQMSDNELYITFYNSLSSHGYKKFYPLLRKYRFFENITSKSKEFDVHAMLFYPETQFKDQTPDLPPPLSEIL